MTSDTLQDPRPDGRSAAARLRAVVSPAVHLVALGAGAVYSFDFGAQIGGPGIGALAGLNGAVICALMAGAALDRLWPAAR